MKSVVIIKNKLDANERKTVNENKEKVDKSLNTGSTEFYNPREQMIRI